MPIRFHEESRTFHLYNGQISYLMKVLPGGQLGQLYFGKALHDRPDFDHLFECCPRPMSVCWSMDDDAYSLEHCRQEYAACGTGDMHLPALDVRTPEGTGLLDLQYKGHAFVQGKPALEGLPATYVEQAEEAETLRVDLADTRSGVTVALYYTIFRDFGAIARHAEIGYTGPGTLELNCAMSLCLDLPDADYEMVELTGAWARERHVVNRPLASGGAVRYLLAAEKPLCGQRNGLDGGFAGAGYRFGGGIPGLAGGQCRVPPGAAGGPGPGPSVPGHCA